MESQDQKIAGSFCEVLLKIKVAFGYRTSKIQGAYHLVLLYVTVCWGREVGGVTECCVALFWFLLLLFFGYKPLLLLEHYLGDFGLVLGCCRCFSLHFEGSADSGN